MKKVSWIVVYIITVHLLLWLLIGRGTLYKQAVVDSEIIIKLFTENLEKMRISPVDVGPAKWIVDQSTADRIGRKQLNEIEKIGSAFKLVIDVKEVLPPAPELDGAHALIYESVWSSPFVAKTELVSWAGPAGFTFQENYHVFVLGFWFRVYSGSGGGG